MKNLLTNIGIAIALGAVIYLGSYFWDFFIAVQNFFYLGLVLVVIIFVVVQVAASMLLKRKTRLQKLAIGALEEEKQIREESRKISPEGKLAVLKFMQKIGQIPPDR